jgi:hypothetical protein
MKSRLPVLALGLVAVLLFSGCFVLRGFRFKSSSGTPAYKITRGGSPVTAVLDLYPHGNAREDDESGYPFVVLDFADAPQDGAQTNWRVVGPARAGLYFDVTQNFGNRRVMTGPRGNTMEVAVLSDPECSEIEGSQQLVEVYMTLDVVNDEDRFRKVARTTIELKAQADASTAGIEDPIAIHVGAWNDDGDGIPEDAEISCTSHLGMTLPIRPAN